MSDETASPSPIKITWLFATLAAFALFLVIGAYSSRMTWNYPDYDQQRAQDRYVTLKKVQADEQAQLSGTAWVDQTKNIVRIPIDEAMAKEIDTLQAQPAGAGCEIAVAAPAPPAGATNAAPAASGAGPAPATSKPKKSKK